MRILAAVILSLVASASAAQQFVYPRPDPLGLNGPEPVRAAAQARVDRLGQ